jgi:putative modified peptide
MSEHDSHDSQEAAHLAQAANVKITMRLTPRQAFDLILKLSSDDAFRAQVQNDPHKVLAGHGIDVPSRDIPLDRALPPKEKLQEVLMQMMARRQGSVSELPFNVDPMYWYFIDFLIFLLHRPVLKKELER